MTFLQALLMGIIQGLTEFLPVSSSGHIVLTSILYKIITNREFSITATEEIFFDIILHLGTLVAILIYFRKDIFLIINNFIKACSEKNFSSNEFKLPLYIVLGTMITVAIVLPLKDFTHNLTSKPEIVSSLLIATGIILFLSEYVSKKIKTKSKQITLKSALVIGIAQGLAIFPGISRSGSTIAAGLFMGVERVACAKYSFLLSIPIILGASTFYPIIELQGTDITDFNIRALLIGFFSSAFIGYICIKYFLKFLAKYSMKLFAIYCCGIGFLMFALFNFFIK